MPIDKRHEVESVEILGVPSRKVGSARVQAHIEDAAI